MSLARSTLIVAAATGASRLLGLVRDVLIAQALGAGIVADAFLIAFRIPNLVRRILSEGALNAGFVPLYARLRAESGAEAAVRFAKEAVSGVGLFVFGIVGIVEIAAPLVLVLLAVGYSEEPAVLSRATLYTRLAFPFVWGVSLAALLSALLNAERRFAAAAIAPVAVNVVLIATLVVLGRLELSEEQQAAWLSGAVSLSGLVHLAIVAGAAVRRLGLRLSRPRLKPEIQKLLLVSAPALLASAAGQMILLAATEVASFTPGAVAWLYYAERVFQLPLGLVGSAVGLVLLPVITERLVAGDPGGLSDAQNRALEAALVLALPAAGALLVLAHPIAQVLFERGAFRPEDTAATAAALIGLAAGLPCAIMAKVLSQLLFAREQYRAALLIATIAVLVTAGAGIVLSPGFGVGGIAFSAALGFVTYAAGLGLFLNKAGWWGPDRRLLDRVLRTFAATGIMSAALFVTQRSLPASEASVPGLAALCLAGLVLYTGAALALRVVTPSELRRLWRAPGVRLP